MSSLPTQLLPGRGPRDLIQAKTASSSLAAVTTRSNHNMEISTLFFWLYISTILVSTVLIATYVCHAIGDAAHRDSFTYAVTKSEKTCIENIKNGFAILKTEFASLNALHLYILIKMLHFYIDKDIKENSKPKFN